MKRRPGVAAASVGCCASGGCAGRSARLDEVREGQLIGAAAHACARPFHRQHGVDEAVGQHHPAEPQRGRETLAHRAQVHHPLGIQALHRPDRLSVVAELAVVVVLEGSPPARLAQSTTAARRAGCSGPPIGKLVGGREQRGGRPRPHELVDPAPSESTASGTVRTPARQHLAVDVQPMALDRDGRPPAVGPQGRACAVPAQTTMRSGSARTPRARAR